MPYANPEDKRANWKRYYAQNREKIIQRAVTWQKDNPERRKANHDKWQESEAGRTYRREWYLANRERFLEQTQRNAKRRLQEDPERVRGLNRNSTARRRARQREAYIEHVDLRTVWERDQGVCQICGEAADPRDWHLDHIVPIVRGGEHSYANVQVSHPVCNRRKAAS